MRARVVAYVCLIRKYGAPTGGLRAVSEARQAQILRDAYRLWAGYRWAGPLFWFDIHMQGYRETVFFDV